MAWGLQQRVEGFQGSPAQCPGIGFTSRVPGSGLGGFKNPNRV